MAAIGQCVHYHHGNLLGDMSRKAECSALSTLCINPESASQKITVGGSPFSSGRTFFLIKGNNGGTLPCSLRRNFLWLLLWTLFLICCSREEQR